MRAHRPSSRPGDATGDSFASIENLTGSAHADSLTGDDDDNVLSGGGGNDEMWGGADSDWLYGGNQNDILNVFQTAVFVLYIAIGNVDGGTAPIAGSYTVFSNPLPHVLILTAIVVGVATSALAFALVVRIHGAYGTLEEDEIARLEEAE